MMMRFHMERHARFLFSSTNLLLMSSKIRCKQHKTSLRIDRVPFFMKATRKYNSKSMEIRRRRDTSFLDRRHSKLWRVNDTLTYLSRSNEKVDAKYLFCRRQFPSLISVLRIYHYVIADGCSWAEWHEDRSFGNTVVRIIRNSSDLGWKCFASHHLLPLQLLVFLCFSACYVYMVQLESFGFTRNQCNY